ncbi:MAG TPA: Gx transporter family protein [Firmicutes bacterium]|nr:Gx transporter family protein [Bacillota bacterium]
MSIKLRAIPTSWHIDRRSAVLRLSSVEYVARDFTAGHERRYAPGIHRLARIAILVSCGLVLYLVEGMIPVPMPVPGAKLGLANIVTLLSIVLLGPVDAFIIVSLRSFLGSLLGGNLTSFWFSLGGAFLATSVMSLAYRYLGRHLSLSGISVLGGVFHNIGQLFVAAIVVRNFGIYFYLPFLLLAGVMTGYLVGFITSMVVRGLNGWRISGGSYQVRRP